MRRVLVLGATGVMGRLICELAPRRLPSAFVVRGSRHPEAGGGESVAVDVRDADSIRRVLDGMDAAINAVGPFDWNPAPLVEACLDAGCHYVDIAETGEFIERAEAAASGSAAPRSCVGSGFSTVPGLVRVLARRWADRGDVESVRVYLSLGSRKRVSATLLYCLLRPLGGRGFGGRYYHEIVEKPFRGITPRYFGSYPAAFEGAGLAVGSRRVPASFFVGMDRSVYAYVLTASARVLPLLSDAVLTGVCRMVRPATPLITRLGTHLGLLALEGLDGGGRVVAEIEVRAPLDGLRIPALPAIWAVREFLDRSIVSGGLVRMEDLFAPGDVAGWLRDEGFEVEGI